MTMPTKLVFVLLALVAQVHGCASWCNEWTCLDTPEGISTVDRHDPSLYPHRRECVRCSVLRTVTTVPTVCPGHCKWTYENLVPERTPAAYTRQTAATPLLRNSGPTKAPQHGPWFR